MTVSAFFPRRESFVTRRAQRRFRSLRTLPAIRLKIENDGGNATVAYLRAISTAEN
jgi:hypothetical protein